MDEITRVEFCIAQSVIAAIRNISTMYEYKEGEDEIHIGSSRTNVLSAITKATTKWQRENAFDVSRSLIEKGK